MSTARNLALGLMLALVSALLILPLRWLPLARTIEWKLYDQRLRWSSAPVPAPGDIVLVAIDESSLRRLEGLVGRWPWPRLVHAQVVDFLADAGVRAIVYDVQFTEHDRRSGFAVGDETITGRESDEAFARSVAHAGRVILLADATFEGLEGDQPARPPDLTAIGRPAGPDDEGFEARPSLALPYPDLAVAARAIGHNMLVLDPDGPVRRAVPFIRVGDRLVPSLGIAAFLATDTQPGVAIGSSEIGVRLGELDVPLEREELPRFEGGPVRFGRRLLVRYRGPPVLADGRSTTFPSFSFYDLFYSREQQLGDEQPLVDPARFKDKTVVIGTTAAGLSDVFTTPFGAAGKMAGAEVHANVIDALRAARFIRRARTPVELMVMAGVAIATSLLLFSLGRRSLTAGLTAVAVVAGAVVGANAWAFARGYWLSLIEPMSVMGVVTLGGLGLLYFVEGREKRAVKQLFSRYLSKDVYQELLANPALAELGGKRRDMTVLFSDVRGFTPLTERGRPEDVVGQLNEYFSAMVEIVFAHRGTIDKFVGDMVMALYGAPLDDDRHADHAVETALAMVGALGRLNARWAAEGRPVLGIGIGINSGEMIAGNIGSERIRSYTVVGDAVNLGARLEALNKTYGTTIIVSQHTAQRLTGAYGLRPLGEVVVKGKSEPIRIFEVGTSGGSGIEGARA